MEHMARGKNAAALRTDGADTESARAVTAATSPESAEIGRLTAEVERLNALSSQLDGLVGQKNRELAELEEQNANLRREVGRLAVGHVQAEAKPRGLSEIEFGDARKEGLSSFVVLTDFKTRTRSVEFHKGQGLDARQHPKLREYIGQGLLLASLPEGGE